MNKPLIILISGTSSGFGQLMAQTIARRGHRVFASMRGLSGKNQTAARELSEWAHAEGVALEIVEMDISDDLSVKTAVDTVAKQAGRLDVVVNNAGVTAFGLQESFGLDQIRQVLELNLVGPLRVDRAALPIMRTQKAGLLVHITSGSGRYVLPFFGPYTGAKYAMEAMAETYRYELAAEGIDSVIVEPGAFSTSLANNAILAHDQERRNAYRRGRQLLDAVEHAQRAAQGGENPQDVANAVAELIDIPFGSRPLRTPVGKLVKSLLADFNATTDRIQKTRLQDLGMEEMLVGAPQGKEQNK
jgi:NAD(P)-dependent dehydrogenase (short-subunit alcohol dehydrogenase family)